MTFCHQCRFKLTLGTEKFCPNCGTDLQQQQKGAGGIRENNSVTVSRTKGDVIGTGVSGNQNVISKELGSYTRQGNIIHFHVNSISSGLFEKIIKVDVTSAKSGDIVDNKKIQETITAKQQTSHLLEEINKIENKEGGTEIEEIKVGHLQVSKKELVLKELILKGNEHAYKGQHKEAMTWYDKALEIDPNYGVAWTSKALSLYSQGKYKEAIKNCDKALEIDPNNADAWADKAAYLANLHKYEEYNRCIHKAIECYDKALEIDPNNADAWKSKALILGQLGRFKEAIESFDKALEIDPNNVSVWTGKGSLLSIWGNDEEARKCFDRASEIDPNDFAVRLYKVSNKKNRYLDRSNHIGMEERKKSRWKKFFG